MKRATYKRLDTVGVAQARPKKPRTRARPAKPILTEVPRPTGPARVLPRAASGWVPPPAQPRPSEVVVPQGPYTPIDTQNADLPTEGTRPLAWDTFGGHRSPAETRRLAGTEAPPTTSPFAESPEVPVHIHDDGRVEDVSNAEPLDDPQDDQPMLSDGVDPGVAVRTVTLADIDDLWDWIRQDEDHGVGFLGRAMATSLDLHAFFADLRDREASGTSAIFAVDQHLSHVGFVVFDPISMQMATAMTHLYLAPRVRGDLTRLLPALLALADARFPTLSLVVSTTSAAAARLYRPFGFETTFVLRRPAAGATHGHDGE